MLRFLKLFSSASILRKVLTTGLCAVMLLSAAASSLIRKGSAQQRANTVNTGLWQDVAENAIQLAGERTIIPRAYRTVQLNKSALAQVLAQAPMEFTASGKAAQVTLSVPMPDGTLGRFRIEESPIMEPGLAAQFPEIKTYRGQGLDDPTATARFDLTPAGFHAIILSAGDTVYVDPYAKGDTTNYISYFKRDLPDGPRYECRVGDFDGAADKSPVPGALEVAPNLAPHAGTLRSYRLALAVTGEYTLYHAPDLLEPDATRKQKAFTALVTTLNRVNGIYERDVSVRMILVEDEMEIVYTNPATDPYQADPLGISMLVENQVNLDTPEPVGPIGEGNYDIGHVMSTGFGGVAYLESVCDRGDPDVPGDGFNAGGFTGLDTPEGDGFDIDFVAHEMGHQFGGNHTFNGSEGSCSGNAEGPAAMEPGSGSTIQAYAGICGSQDLQLHSDAYFHVKSLEEIIDFTEGNGHSGGDGDVCSVKTVVANNAPTVNAGADYTIPKNTPFTLTATGSDPDGDPLTFAWEEYDTGPASPPDTDADGQPRPIFRSYNPTLNPSRTFPSLRYILNNGNTPPQTYDCGRGAADPCLTGEILPQIERTMKFQVTARDNRAAGGGINADLMQVSVRANAGPFVVTAPNTGVSLPGNSSQTVTWDVANTNVAPINAANVKISLSTDGGNTFPVVLAASTPNDGAEAVNLPDTATSTARIKVEAVGNIFFDISNTNFTITGTSAAIPRLRISDFDGDNKTDTAVWRQNSTGDWVLFESTTNGLQIQTDWGHANLSDIAVPGDYDGDEKTDFAVWRSNEGNWYIIQSSTGTVRLEGWGQSGDVPTPGDFDGDGKTDVAVFRANEGNWYIRQSGGGNVVQGWGTTGDKVVHRDYDGDGKTDMAVYRPTEGNWYVLKSTGGALIQGWGLSSDQPVPGDYDGDGLSDFAVFRAGEGNWYIRGSNGNNSVRSWGIGTDAPVPGDYDGDNKTDIAIWRGSEGTWYIIQSSNNAVTLRSLGLSGDVPVPSAYLP
jgi:Metallo-peptidase family M12B Reprolysin-like/FG-GAP-like repeat